MATSYTTKLSSDEMFADLKNNPGFAYEVSQTWNVVKKLLKKRKEFNGVNLKKITEPQWQAIYQSITKDEKDRRLFNPIITNRNRPAIDDPELWLYGPLSEDKHIQDVISSHLLGNAQEAQSKEKTETTLNQPGIYAATATAVEAKQPVATTPAPTKAVTPASTTLPPGAPNRPEAAFMEQARQQLVAANPKTPPTDEAVQLRAYQLRQHVLTGEHFQTIKKHATGTPSQPTSSHPDKTPSPIIVANKSGNVIPQAPGNSSAIITSSRPQVKASTPPLIIPRKSFPFSPPSRTELTDEGEVEEVSYSTPSPDYDQDTRNDEEPRMQRRRSPNLQRLSPRGVTRGARGAVQGARGAAQAVRGIATLVRAAPLLANPYVLAGIGVGLLILLVVVLLTKPGGGENVQVELETAQTQVENPSTDCQKDSQGCADQVDNGDTSNKAVIDTENLYASAGQSVLGVKDTPRVLAFGGPDFKKFLEEIAKSIITYNIIVSYDGQADDIRVTYPIIPSEAAFVSATGICHLTKDGQGRVTLVEWSVKENQNIPQTTFTKCTLGTTPSPAANQPKAEPLIPEKQGVQGTSTQSVNFTTYTQSPYYLPSPGISDTQYSTTTINYLNDLGARVARHQTYLISKTKGAKYVDPFLSVIWTGAIEGIGDNPYFWNCQDRSHDINAGCTGGFYSGGWQVGYGMQVSQAVAHIASDFDEAYGAGSSTSIQKTQQVGQAVINSSNGKIRNPSTFPAKSLTQLVAQSNQGNSASRQAIAILLMDKELGAIAMAREVAGDIAAKDNWAATMRDWGSYYGDNMQNFANRAKVLADKYNGSATGKQTESNTTTTTGKVSFPTTVFQIKVLPAKKDFTFTSQPASADVIGGVGGDNPIGTNTSDGPTSNTSGTIDVGSNPAPNISTCNGVYTLSGGQHDGNNFGDPDCQLAQSQRISYDFNGKHWGNVPKALVDLLKQLDPAGVGYWIGISACEAPGFDPNNVSVAVNGNAYGLFQMGARFVNGQESPFGEGVGLNGQYDRGDVNWKTQVSNAVNYHLKNLSGGWGYWECAKIVWGL